MEPSVETNLKQIFTNVQKQIETGVKNLLLQQGEQSKKYSDFYNEILESSLFKELVAENKMLKEENTLLKSRLSKNNISLEVVESFKNDSTESRFVYGDDGETMYSRESFKQIPIVGDTSPRCWSTHNSNESLDSEESNKVLASITPGGSYSATKEVHIVEEQTEKSESSESEEEEEEEEKYKVFAYHGQWNKDSLSWDTSTKVEESFADEDEAIKFYDSLDVSKDETGDEFYKYVGKELYLEEEDSDGSPLKSDWLEVEEEEEEVEEEEEEVEEEEEEVEEEEEEVEEVIIDKVMYYTTDKNSGKIYADEDGEVGDHVGNFNNGKPVFYK